MKTFEQLHKDFDTLWEVKIAQDPEVAVLKPLALKWFKGGCIAARTLNNGEVLTSMNAGEVDLKAEFSNG